MVTADPMTRATPRKLRRSAAARDELDMAVAQELGDRYRVERRERCGPLSCVYRARDLAAGQVVALKVLPHAWTQERAREGFEAAMAAWATLDHAHIIPVRDYGRTSQLLWYAMPHIDGRSLDDVLRNGGPLEPRTCLRLVAQLAAALHYAHGRGIIHGNVKPGNVIVVSDGSALLGDFAVARALEAGAPPRDPAAARSRLAHYVAPEERHTRQLGPAGDQYALAVLALECLEAAASPGASPPVPRGVAEALTRALSPAPQDRYSTVLDLVAALDAAAAPTPAPVSQPAAPLAPLPVAPPRPAPQLVWDDGYDAAPPRGHWVRWVAGGAALMLLVVAVAVGVVRARRGGAPPAEELVPVPPAPAAESPPQDTAAPLVSRPAPAPAPPAPRRAPPRAVPRPVPRATAVAQGRLFVGATPWGDLYIDDRLIGHTPKAALPLDAGWHNVRIARDGFAPFEQRVHVAPGEEVRLTGIVLRKLGP
jgi:hypothetical protein